MPVDRTLEGTRNRLLTSIFGRRLGLETHGSLGGMAGSIEPIDGFTSGGTTVTSTSVATNLPAYGLSAIGASGASATTAYNLDAPIPGVRKTLFVPTTGYAVVGTTASGAFIASTASVTSTYGIITFTGKGNFVELMGLTTALWGVISDGGINTVALTSAASTSSTVTRNVTYG